MARNHLSDLLFFLAATLLSPVGAEEKLCESEHAPNKLSLRHIESKGIGYNQGYTTLEGFFVSPSITNETRCIRFFDLRGHLFNNGKPAANVGMGFRWDGPMIWGVNVYYDYRKTSHLNYNQVSCGLEALGRVVDLRVNGYKPVGKYKSSLYGAQSSYFSGHSLYILRKREFALEGINGEIGFHMSKSRWLEIYSALGPYYFTNSGKNTVGGQLRLACNVRDILRVEGNTSYDPLFGWIGQGQVALSYAFNSQKIRKKENKKRSCQHQATMWSRAFQRVDRQEIIVVDTKKEKQAVVNPDTGLPYFFVFVDNTSGTSAGTYEAPFNTLAAAQTHSKASDIIAVFPGDGTTNGMDAGITLKSGQKLWGLSVVHSLRATNGMLKISPLAMELPSITAPGTVITTAVNNDVEGLYLIGNDSQEILTAVNVNRASIQNNIFFHKGSAAGINLAGRVETVTIANNTFIANGISQSVGITAGDITHGGNIIISNNLFTANSPSSSLWRGIDFSSSGAHAYLALTCSIVNNVFNSPANPFSNSFGIGITFSPIRCLIANNKINIPSGMSGTVAGISCDFSSNLVLPATVTLRNNEVTTFTPAIPAYLLKQPSGSSVKMNLAPDNIGAATYIGF